MNHRVRTRAMPLAVVVVAIAATAAHAAVKPRDLLRSHCGQCHFDGADEGGLKLDQLLAAAKDGRPQGDRHAAWVAVWRNLRAGTMPPPDEPQPAQQDRAAVVTWIEREVLGVDPARPDPGRVTVRRLNRVEYSNTIRDLTGIQFPVDTLPADDTGHGFDTIGDVLSVSPMLMEKYLDAAALVAGKAVAAMPRGKAKPTTLFPAGPPPDDAPARREWLRRVFRSLADRAFRRPVDDETLGRIVAVATAADRDSKSIEKQLVAGFTAILAAPRFLFRIERPAAGAAGPVAPLDDWSLATRLSYFLWSTMPDGELFDLAAKGTLRANLDRQVKRMLADSRSDSLVQNFVGQWLQTRDVEALAFDVAKILGMSDRKQAERIFSGDVRRAMRQQTEMHFAHLLRENLPATDLLVGEETFLNANLAKFYGIDDVKGKEMRLVKLPADKHRGGLLTHGSFLVVTSNPSRTSPVKRGLFILDNLLGAPPPPAPADVPPLEKAASGAGRDASMRQLMEQHRSDALCASCHARMDPLGLALEHYNAAGQWRDTDRGAAIDTAGRLITGERFADADELARVIAGPRRTDFHRCLAEKLLTYALGRGIEYFDAPAVDTIVKRMGHEGRMHSLVMAVVESGPFTKMRVEPGSKDR